MEIKTLTPDQLALIKKPLPKEALSDHPTKKNMTSIKPVYISERLNEVFGVGVWSLKSDLLAPIREDLKKSNAGRDYSQFTLLVKTSFEVPSYGIYFDCIASSTNEDMGDSAKGGISDNMSKISSWLGIGQDVYKGIHTPKTANNFAPKVEAPKQPLAPSKEFTESALQKAFKPFNYLTQVLPLLKEIRETKEEWKSTILCADIITFEAQVPKPLQTEIYNRLTKK